VLSSQPFAGLANRVLSVVRRFIVDNITNEYSQIA